MAVAADQLGVSIASIRNWIKTGYLTALAPNTIHPNSLSEFTLNVAGKEKLVRRANKGHLDQHDHLSLKIKIQKELFKDADPSGCSQSYESGLSNTYRNQEGIYYTPLEIVEKMFASLPGENRCDSFCDPCCGSGNFLIGAVQAGFRPENIFGFDVDGTALAIARARLAELTQIEPSRFNLVQLDFLQQTQKQTFDVIFTNPPWGKKLPKQIKDELAKRYGTGKSNDTASLFLAAALDRLKVDGRLAMLLPESFFQVASFEEIRQSVLSQVILEFSDHGKPFPGLVTKAKSLLIKKSPSEPQNRIRCNSQRGTHFRNQASFTVMPKRRFNFAATQQDVSVIQHLRNQPHITLKNNASWGMGIVTGNNKKHVHNTPGRGRIPVWAGSDISCQQTAMPTRFISDQFDQYQQVARTELFEADKKLIYKFISSRLVFYCDREQRYLLNSANFLIPDAGFPVSCEKLASFFNSSIANWLFRILFDTHKVLRSDLETLPIFANFLKSRPKFDEQELLSYLGIEPIDGSFRIRQSR